LWSSYRDKIGGVSSDDPRIGTTLQGRYRVLDRIAEGGMGAVYRGERLGLRRLVAIKFLHSHVADQEQFRKRFEIEARAMSRLSHPHCVSVTDFGVVDVPYLVMDYATGQPLGKLIEQGPIPIRRALHITCQLLAGLGHAHSQEIIHRDIKPDNLILDEALGARDHLRVLDFGLAKLRDFGVDLTQELAVGTPSYMAPEQTLSMPVDPRTDLYAVGVVLYEMLSGTKPFKADDTVELFRLQREGTAVPIRTVRPEAGFSAELDALVQRALAKPPAGRFQTASGMTAALEAVPEASPPSAGARSALSADGVAPTVAISMPPARTAPKAASAATVAPTPGARGESRRRRRRLLAGGFVVVAVCVPVGAYLTARNGTGPAGLPTEVAASRPAPPTAPTVGEPSAEVRAQIAYRQGNTYCGKMWWSEALASYREAIRLDSRYREDPRLINNMIGALMSTSFHPEGARFLRDEIGPPAVPLLEAATQKAESTTTRKRAADLLRSMRDRR
jgi:serine/threonine-protein kinase